ncbi:MULTISPECIES: helix-turn-helix domain-containing protein [unclassified Pseudoclavibacter]|uniref:helix-turn-helix domain-containing protein n=1 Tax=unclassified Pseudoclavibacter TaxID=2615177 RepID=UPI0020162763|nr:XRE family transcriptional regulator [Pseudoclavibacter sp. Marseille-Q4354]
MMDAQQGSAHTSHTGPDTISEQTASIPEALSRVAPRLREIRQARGMTLSEVAHETGLSVSTLSRLESGGRRPSLDALLPLARCYRVPLDDLVGAPSTGDPRIHPKPVKRGDRVYLALSRATDGMQAFKVLVAPQKPADRDKPVQLRVHEGTEWCYVLAGRLRLQLDDEVTILEAGEAAEFDTTRPHSMTNDGATTLEILSLFSRQAERSHIHETG